MTAKRLPFLEVFKDVSAGNKKVPQSDLREAGVLAVVDQGQCLIAGYVDDEALACRASPPVIVFGDHTRALKFVDFKFAMGADGTKVLVPRIEAVPKYLFYALSAIEIPSAGYSRHFKYLKKVSVPVPSLSEQKRIARILDEADDLRAKRRASIEQIDALLQSIFLDMFGECDRPPISIGSPTFGSVEKFVPLAEVARLATGHTPDREKPEYWGGEIPWVSLTDIRDLDGAISERTGQTVTEAGLANSSAVKLPSGTVCFSRTASIGFVTVMGREMATSQDFVNWVCGPKLNPVYLMWALRMSRPYLLGKSSGSTHKTIYYRHAEQFEVFLPPIQDQRSFAEAVAIAEGQKAHMRTHLAELDTLFASLQSRAFNGEL